MLMAYNSTLHSSHDPSSLGWDHNNNLGVFNADTSFMMETSTAFLPEPDFSTGYLQDVLMEWNDQCKRRRLQLHDNDHDQRASFENIMQNYWSSNWIGEPLENFNCLSKVNDASGVSGEPLNSSVSCTSDGENIFSEIKTVEDSLSGPETYNSPSCMHESKTQTSSDFVSASEGGLKRKKKVFTGLVYPFALVKPGGVDGDMTLNDINERILMPPTRPVRHPVGDFAGRPSVSPDGPGLSGKAVVALTKIQTQGRGTITIIRTRG